VVTHKTILDLNVNGRITLTTFYVTGLGKNVLILGLSWLRKHNPIVNWAKGTIQNRLPIAMKKQINRIHILNQKLTMNILFTKLTMVRKATIEEIIDEEAPIISKNPNTNRPLRKYSKMKHQSQQLFPKKQL
jgi:hypothetical protein